MLTARQGNGLWMGAFPVKVDLYRLARKRYKIPD